MLKNLFMEEGSKNIGAIFGIVILIAVLIFLIVSFCLSIKIVRQATAINVERLGKFHKTLETGVHLTIPFFDKCSAPYSLKEIICDFAPQPVITKDNVTMQIDTVVYFQITNVKLYQYGVQKPISAIENLTATTLRNIVGELELDETLTSRDTVNSKMRIILDEATDPWGIKVNRVELKNILPPKDIQEAMEKQMRAERERRESILKAEGEKKSTILVAEGEKQAKILAAEAEKESRILKAEGEKQALIREAEAKAKQIELINNSKPSDKFITLETLEALKAMADGKSTKLIIPSNVQDIVSIASVIKDSMTEIKQSNDEGNKKSIDKNKIKKVEK